MTKIILLILLFCIYRGVNAQSKSYTANNGVTYHLKDTIYIGYGSGEKGIYKFINVAYRLTLKDVLTRKKYPFYNLDAGYAKKYGILKYIFKPSKQKGTNVFFLLYIPNYKEFSLQIDSAIKYGEILPPIKI